MRRARKLLYLVGLAALLGALQLTLSGHLLLNITGSIPRGIYWISPRLMPLRGQLVTFTIPEPVRSFLHERQYVPRSIQLLAKPVAAVAGDHVCTQPAALVINGIVLGKIRDADLAGRPLPRRVLCRRLEQDEVFLATEREDSFDSRYFGPVVVTALRGTLTALVTE